MAASGKRWAFLAAVQVLAGCTVAVGDNVDEQAAVGSVAGEALRPGQRVVVTVEGQPGLSGTYTLDRDGRLAFPLLGQVDAHNRTDDELAAALVAGLADGYLREPRVVVASVQQRPFFISGEVRRPGSYPYHDGMTVADAVAAAGGALGDGDLAVVVAPAGRERDTRRVALDAKLRPGDIVALEAPRG